MSNKLTATEMLLLAMIAGGVGVWVLYSAPFQGTLVLVLTAILAKVSYQPIPTDPPNVGLLTQWQRRTGVLREAGFAFIFKYFPLNEALVMDTVAPTTLQFAFSEVRCRATQLSAAGNPMAGGAVTVKGVITFTPDASEPERFGKFINSGRRPGVQRIVVPMLEKDVRFVATDVDWLMLAFSKASLTARLVTLLTGEGPTEQTEAGCKAFLEAIFEGALADVKGLGISIRQVEITSVEPEGALRKTAEGLAIEELQRLSEAEDIKTATMLAQSLMNASNGTLTFDQAWERISVQRGRTQATRVTGTGSRGTIVDVDHGHH